jgi:PAS domain S-box-containing protein
MVPHLPDRTDHSPANPRSADMPSSHTREQQLLEEIAELQTIVAQLQQRNNDLQEAESALQERETQFQVLVEHSQDVIYVHSLEGIFNYVSPSIQTVLGYSASDLIGKSFIDLIHTDDVVRCWNMLDMIQRTRESYLGQAMRIRHYDRSWRWIVANVTPIADEHGIVTAYQGIARNITERFEAEDAQRKAQDQVKTAYDFLRSILDKILEPIFVKDQQGRFVLVNASFCDLFDLTPRKALGKFNHDLLPLDIARTCQTLDQSLLQTAENQVLEMSYAHPSGQDYVLLISQSLYQDAQQQSFIVGSLRNLTDSKSTKEALVQAQLNLIRNEKMSALGMMIAGIAHEIKSPLNFVVGNLPPLDRDLQTLLQLLRLYQQELPQPSAELATALQASDFDFLREDLPKLLNSITIGATRMQAIVQSLQHFAHQDTESFQTFSLEEAINSTLLILKPRLKACGDRPSIQISTNHPQLPLIEGHPGQINQVLMNLLNNAIDALETRYDEWQKSVASQPNPPHRDAFIPTIMIQMAVCENTIQIQIQDNGVGISAANQARLFQQNFTTKPIGKGTGMGLSISHQIITQHHQGRLTCDSEVNQGTTMTITLPIAATLPIADAVT